MLATTASAIGILATSCTQPAETTPPLSAEHTLAASSETSSDGPDSLSRSLTIQLADDAKPPIWSVVIGGSSDPYDPLFADLVNDLARLDFDAEISNCLPATAEALGMDPASSYTVHVTVESEAEALAAQAELRRQGMDSVVSESPIRCPE